MISSFSSLKMLKINFLTYLVNFQYFCWRCSWLIEYLILNIEKKILFYKCPMIQLISNSIFPRYPFLKNIVKIMNGWFDVCTHSVEIMEIYSHTFLTKILWKQCFHSKIYERVDFTKYSVGESEFSVFTHCMYSNKPKIYL